MSCDCGVCQHPVERDEFCEALEHIAGITAVMMTGDSAVSDFCLDDDEYGQLADALHTPVNRGDMVVDVLTRMAQRR